MGESFIRLVENLAGRFDGPFHLRLIVQPAVAVAMAMRAGIRDSRRSKPPFFWDLLSRSGNRRELLRQCWSDVKNVLIVASILDLIYQVIVHGRVYPLELLITATALAIVPYLLVRGPVNRILGIWRNRGTNFARDGERHRVA